MFGSRRPFSSSTRRTWPSTPTTKMLENIVSRTCCERMNSPSRAGSASAVAGSWVAALRSARCRPTSLSEIDAASRRASSSCESRTTCSVLRPTSRSTKITVSATLASTSSAPASAKRTFNERRLESVLPVRMPAFRCGCESSATSRCGMCESAVAHAKSVNDWAPRAAPARRQA